LGDADLRFRSALLLLVFGFLGGIAVFFLLQRAGILGPGNSSRGDSRLPNLAEEAELAERRIASRFPKGRSAARGEEVNFRLEESDLRDLALAALAGRAEGRRVLEMTSRVDAEIDDGEIGVTLVLDLSKLPLEELGEEERAKVEEVLDMLPFLGEGSLPVGFYGRPEASSGRLKLTGDPRLKVSILKLSVETASERLGIPEEQIREALEIEWPGWEVLRVSVEGKVVDLVVRAA